MQKKEHYRHALPHYQQPGQAYFITWCLKDAVPLKALERYTKELEMLGAANSDTPVLDASWNSHHPDSRISLIRQKYLKAYNNFLDAEKRPKIDLSKPKTTQAIADTLHFWHGKQIENIAFCIMPNHVHWVIQLFNKNEKGELVYLQDIMQSVKRFSANEVNKIENRKGSLWQKESYDVTIRNEYHLYRAINYTLNNPVKAGLINDWRNWHGCWCNEAYLP